MAECAQIGLFQVPTRYVSIRSLKFFLTCKSLFSSHIAYLVLIAPLSVVRMLDFRNRPSGFKQSMTSSLIYSLSGFVDVVLFIWAKPAFGMESNRRIDSIIDTEVDGSIGVSDIYLLNT